MENLILEAINGNELAFDKLIISIENDLYKIARMRLSYEEDIEDAVQETIIQVYRNIKKVKQPQYFKTWVVRILINNCNKIYRKTLLEKKVQYNEKFVEEYKYIQNDEGVENLDFYILIKELKYKERIVIILYYLCGFTTKQIGKILKIPESTIKTRMNRARRKLKNTFKGGADYERNRQ